jgi:hypothetical protein
MKWQLNDHGVRRVNMLYAIKIIIEADICHRFLF